MFSQLMQAVHRTLAIAVLVMTAAFTAGAIGAAWRQGSRPWLEWGRRALMTVIVLQVLAGLFLYGTGHRPAESLHLLYGAAALAAIPFGSYFAAEAPPRPRAVVLAAAGVLTLGIIFRSFVTG
jgi:ABC-type arginine transport system permease subunit